MKGSATKQDLQRTVLDNQEVSAHSTLDVLYMVFQDKKIYFIINYLEFKFDVRRNKNYLVQPTTFSNKVHIVKIYVLNNNLAELLNAYVSSLYK